MMGCARTDTGHGRYERGERDRNTTVATNTPRQEFRSQSTGFFQTNFATRSAHSDNFGSSLKDKTPKKRIPTASRTAIPLACLASGDMGQESR